MTVSCADVETPMGRLTLAATETGLVRIGLPPEDPAAVRDELRRKLGGVVEDPSAVEPARRELDEYFAGTRRDFTMPLDWSLAHGFRLRVLEEMFRIPYGETVSYGGARGTSRQPPRPSCGRSRLCDEPDPDRAPLSSRHTPERRPPLVHRGPRVQGVPAAARGGARRFSAPAAADRCRLIYAVMSTTDREAASLRSAYYATRPISRDNLVPEDPSLGLVAFASPFDPEPSLRVEDGRVVELDGKREAEFDLIDEFVARHGIDVTVAEEAMALDTISFARMLVDPGVPRGEITRLVAGMTPAKIAATLSILTPVEILQAMQKMRARKTPSIQAHVTNRVDHPLLIAADAASAVALGFRELETTVPILRDAPANALALLIGGPGRRSRGAHAVLGRGARSSSSSACAA